MGTHKKKRPLRLKPNDEKALELLVSTTISKVDISEETGVPYSRLNYLQKKTGLERPKKGEQSIPLQPPKRRANALGRNQVITREWLIEHRYDKGMTLQQMGDMVGLTRERIRQYLKQEGLDGTVILDRQKKVKIKNTPIDTSYFDKIETEEQAYWLGYLTAKGRIGYDKAEQKSVKFSVDEEGRAHLERFLSLTKCEAKFERLPSDKKFRYSLHIHSETFVGVLLANGASFPKHQSFQAPADIPAELLRHYVRGVAEVKSFIVSLKTGRKLYLTSGTLDFLNFYTAFMKTQGIQYPPRTIREHQPGNYLARLASMGKIGDIFTFLYEGAHIFLPSKKEEAENYLAYAEELKQDLLRQRAERKSFSHRKRKRRLSPNSPLLPTEMNDSFFDTIDTEEKAYWLGYLAHTFTLSYNKDDQAVLSVSFLEDILPHMRKFFSALESAPRVRSAMEYSGGIHKKRYHVSITNDSFSQKAAELGLTRTDWEKVPFQGQLKEELMHHYVRGYYDNHGFFTWNVAIPKIVIGGGEEFLESFADFLRQQEVPVPSRSVGKHDKWRKQYRMSFGQVIPVQEFALLLYKDASIFRWDKELKLSELFGGGES